MSFSAKTCPNCGRRKHAVVRTPSGRKANLLEFLGAILFITLIIDYVSSPEGSFELGLTKVVFIYSLIDLGWWNIVLILLVYGYIHQD